MLCVLVKCIIYKCDPVMWFLFIASFTVCFLLWYNYLLPVLLYMQS